MELLQIPEWFPQCLVPKARELHARELSLGHDADAALIERLVADHRMDKVWRELSKTKRVEHQTTSEPWHRVTPPLGSFPVPDIDLHQRAFLELFIYTFSIARHPNLPGASIPYAERARQLRLDAETVATERSKKEGEKVAKKLIAAAEEYERLARTPRTRDQIVSITRDLAELMKERFGSHFYGTVATLVSVAVDQKLGVDFVRECCQSYSGEKGKKRT